MNNPKKIMYLLDAFAKPGGVERVIGDKMNYLVNNGFQITLVTYQQGNHPVSFPLNPSIKHLDTNTPLHIVYKYNRIYRLFKRWQIRKEYRKKLQLIINEEQPDAIIITTYGITTCGIVSEIGTTAKLIAEAHVPKSMTIEGNIRSKNPIRKFIDKKYNEYQCRKIRKFDLLVLLTNSSIQDWDKIAKRIIVIPNPVTYYPEDLQSKELSTKSIISVGRLHPQKGYDRLIKAFAIIADQCPQWNVKIYGNGDDKLFLTDLINSYNLQNRIILNDATPLIYEKYVESDFFVMSSRFEGMPLVLLEAMACGIPCVSFACKYGPEDIIENGNNGFIVEDGNIQQLADKILWMCNHDMERQKMGNNARKCAEKYKKETIMPKWVQLFNNIL